MSNNDYGNDSSAVRVIVRERPARDTEGVEEVSSVISYSESSANILIADGRPFTFDKVLGPSGSQEQLFLDISPLVGKVKEGFNCTALAYGQTGTGKSYSMGLDLHDVGIIPRCLSEILNLVGNAASVSDINSDQQSSSEISASFIEIYNEKVFDLLSENTTEPIVSRGYKYKGGTKKVLKSLDDCYSVLFQGNKNRHVRPTKMNSKSSRSHAIFTIHLYTVSGNGVLNSRLNLVDLAGSEGVRRTGHQGVAMSEGVNINQGLLSIGKVLQAKALGHKVIPYRDSILTSVLQDSLSENSYLTLLACISPHRADLSETLSTLRFAQSVKQLKHSPHNHLIVTEYKGSRMKTPKKANMAPASTKRPNINTGISLGFKAFNTIYHNKTFCTPSKLKRNAKKLNQSEIGLTPRQKAKDQRRIIGSLETQFRGMQPNLLLINREPSISLDKTLESRASIMSLNVSSSTVLGNDGTMANKTLSYSPVVRKCLEEFENIIENKLSHFMDTLKDLSKENFQQNTQIVDSSNSLPSATNSGPLPLVLRNELKSIIQEVLQENDEQSKITLLDNGESSQSILLESSPLRENLNCQLFDTSSPVFKVPLAPNKTLNRPLGQISKIDDSFTHSNITTRRSRRISQRVAADNSLNASREYGISNETLRRSRRISSKLEQIRLHTDASKISNFGCSLQMTSTSELFEKRKSVKQLHIERRQSIREAMDLKKLAGTETAKSNRIASLDSIIESYLTSGSNGSALNTKGKKTNIQKHRKAILDLLNSGSRKELQILPQIGPKTAFQLLTQRTLNGKFKTIAQLEKLPIWRGNSWTRFAQANLLID
ncbi:kinesin-like protein Nod isoform X3 [Ceratitis capitata]|uniref:kinesin-like protein Nod isoform X3 n=1 Tax=Ceratitis capitata TaxID=7213 RepID=UPI0006188333|nr:kinesin-like protein Nod isoform X3 [Ceratitis capitata]